jgi:spore photoproduct lyase
MIRWTPGTLWIEHGEADSALACRVRTRLPKVPVRMVANASEAEPAGNFSEGKRRLLIKRHRGTFLQHCPAGTPGLVCCNYLVASFASNCPFDCSYCFLQDYVANNSAIKAFSNVGDGLAEIDAVLRAHPDRTFRIGTGEVADSLALDHLTDLSCELVPFFAARSNGLLELKTKSAGIDNLLGLDPKDRTVVSWSLNATRIMAAEEDDTATLEERLQAALRVQAAGYKVGFHFDPIIAHEGWEDGYRQVIEQVFPRLDTRRVAWVSLGSLRMTPGLKAAIKARANPSLALTGELVPGPDGKERAWRGLRVKIYRRMLEWLQQIDERMPVYVCMEPPGVWSKVFGHTPSDREVAERLVTQQPVAHRVNTAR